MKRYLLISFCLLCLSFYGVAQEPDTYTNRILHADYSDPDVIRVGDDYYMVASSFNCVPGLPVLHSRDLVSWVLNGKKYISAGETFRARPGRWIGAKIGFFALRDGITNDAGSADIDWFRIESEKMTQI